jgi:hypothetical protein
MFKKYETRNHEVCVGSTGKKQFIKWKMLGYLRLKLNKDNSPMPVWNSKVR